MEVSRARNLRDQQLLLLQPVAHSKDFSPLFVLVQFELMNRAYNDILLGTLIIKLQKINVITIFYLPQVGYSK